MTESAEIAATWLSTGQAAEVLGFSRTYLVQLCDQGVLPHERRRTHRRLRRSDVERFKGRSQPLTRDQRRSMWLGHAVAGKVVADPNGVLGMARDNLAQLQRLHIRGQAARWLDEWARMLDGPVEGVLDALTTGSERGRELRQNTPFAGVLTDNERQFVLGGFRDTERSNGVRG